MKINIGTIFLYLLSTHFPPNHNILKIFNKNRVEKKILTVIIIVVVIIIIIIVIIIIIILLLLLLLLLPLSLLFLYLKFILQELFTIRKN